MNLMCELLCGFVMLIQFAGCQNKTARNGFLPNSSQIVSIEAKLDGNFLGEPSTEQFQVDDAIFDKISRCLSTNPIELTGTAGFGKAVGVLVIVDRAATAYHIEFPWSGKWILVFTINGKWFSRNGTPHSIDPSSGKQLDFVADESVLLYKALRKHYKDTKAN